MTRRISSRQVTLTSTFTLLALGVGGLTACGDSPEDEFEDGHFYCTDRHGVVVAEEYCDTDDEHYNSGNFFYFMGSSLHAPPANYTSYPVGSKLPANSVKVPVSDQAARTRLKLPPTGRVQNGTVKVGVVGKGGVGSAAKPGSGSKGGSGGKSGGS